MAKELFEQAAKSIAVAFEQLSDTEQIELIAFIRAEMLSHRQRRVEQLECQIKESDERLKLLRKGNEYLIS